MLRWYWSKRCSKAARSPPWALRTHSTCVFGAPKSRLCALARVGTRIRGKIPAIGGAICIPHRLVGPQLGGDVWKVPAAPWEPSGDKDPGAARRFPKSRRKIEEENGRPEAGY